MNDYPFTMSQEQYEYALDAEDYLWDAAYDFGPADDEFWDD